MRQAASPTGPRRRVGQTKKSNEGNNDEEKKPKKTPTVWSTQKVTKQTMSKLDFSKELEGEENTNRYIDNDDSSDRSEESESDEDGSQTTTTGFFSRISSAIQNITGNKVLTASDLDGILSEFKSALMTKNVASEVVDSLVLSVKTSLIGTKTESFTSVKSALRSALTDAIQRTLTHKK